VKLQNPASTGLCFVVRLGKKDGVFGFGHTLPDLRKRHAETIALFQFRSGRRENCLNALFTRVNMSIVRFYSRGVLTHPAARKSDISQANAPSIGALDLASSTRAEQKRAPKKFPGPTWRQVNIALHPRARKPQAVWTANEIYLSLVAIRAAFCASFCRTLLLLHKHKHKYARDRICMSLMVDILHHSN
jgi:hypothetical protein